MTRIQLGAMAFQRGCSRPSDSAPTGGTIETRSELLGRKGATIMPLGISLCRKQLDLFWGKLNIVRKKGKLNFKSLKSGEHPFLFYLVQMCIILFTKKEIPFIDWPNRDDSDRLHEGGKSL
jgi:hypothetical protein